MGQRAAWLAGLVALCAAGTPALAAPSAYDVAFVAAFEEACVPGRLGYQSTRDTAEAAGWRAVTPEAHPELRALLAVSEEAAKDPELQATYEMAAYGREVAGLPHFLVVSRTSAVISAGEQPFVQVGCHLYNLDATVPVDPEPVTALIGNPIARTDEADGAISHVWGPGCTMPRTFDTYLSFVAEGSEVAAAVPFTGVALNFTTSEPAPGEVVPETYCTDNASLDATPQFITVAAAQPATKAGFVAQFADICLKDRMSYEGTRAAAEADGWTADTAEAHPELAALIAFSNAAANDIKLNNGEFDFAIYGKTVDAVTRYLVLSNAFTTPGNARQALVGCYLYDFDATVAPDPADVNALLGATPTAQQVDADISSWQWNAPASLPGTLDVYLNYVPEGSQYQSQYGFAGLVLLVNSAAASPSALPGSEGTGG